MNKIELKIAIKVVHDALMGMGIYPQSIVNEKDIRTERTEWQNCWNNAVIKIGEKISNGLDSLEEISDDLALLMIANVGWSVEDGIFRLNMNDTFYYGSDSEDVSIEEIPEVAKLFTIYGYKGLTYWVSKKRNEKPMIPKYRADVEEIENKEKNEH